MKILGVLFLVCVALFGSSCASSKRMMRLSPFNESEAAMPDPDRVNVWPLVYKNDAFTSVLWPIVDIDQTGFAIRPLINKEQEDWSLLFPLASVNTKRKVGWLGPVYHYEKEHGVFPLFHSGKNLDWVGPFWWSTAGGYGVFPVAYWNKDGRASWVWPLYSRNVNDHSWHYTAVSGLLSHRSDNDGKVKQRAFPLYFHSHDDKARSTLVLPVYYARDDETSKVRINPLYGYGLDRESGESFRSVLGPLYVHSKGKERKDTYLAAIYHRGVEGDEGSHRIWPLYAWSNEPDYPDPLYRFSLLGYRGNEGNSSLHITPFVGKETWSAGDYSSQWVWPLYLRARYPAYKKDSLALCSLKRNYKDGALDRIAWSLPLWLMSGRKNLSEKTASWNVLYGAMNYKADAERQRLSILKYLYRRDQKGEQVSRDIFPFIKWDSGEEASRFSLLWRVLNVERSAAGTKGHLLFVPWGG